MFTIEDGFVYDVQEWLFSVVDLANYTGDVTDLTSGHAFLAIGVAFVAVLFFSNPSMK